MDKYREHTKFQRETQ